MNGGSATWDCGTIADRCIAGCRSTNATRATCAASRHRTVPNRCVVASTPRCWPGEITISAATRHHCRIERWRMVGRRRQIYDGYSAKSQGFAMAVPLQKWGNSVGVRLPKPMLEQVGLKEGAQVDVLVEGDHLVIRRERSKLADMLAQCRPE